MCHSCRTQARVWPRGSARYSVGRAWNSGRAAGVCHECMADAPDQVWAVCCLVAELYCKTKRF